MLHVTWRACVNCHRSASVRASAAQAQKPATTVRAPALHPRSQPDKVAAPVSVVHRRDLVEQAHTVSAPGVANACAAQRTCGAVVHHSYQTLAWLPQRHSCASTATPCTHDGACLSAAWPARPAMPRTDGTCTGVRSGK